MTGSDTIATEAFCRPAGRDGHARPIDQWLRRSLSDTYDRVLTENLPDTWLAMIDGKRSQGGAE